MANVSSKPSLVRPRAPPTPALLISTCSGSPRARNSTAQARTEARSDRSSGRNATASFPVSAEMPATAARPFSAERQATNTLPPRLASPVAVARPMPVLAPVSRKVRPDRSPEFDHMVNFVPHAGVPAACGPARPGSSPAPGAVPAGTRAGGVALCSPNRASGHCPGILQEGWVRIAGARRQGEPAGTDAAAGTTEEPPPDASARRSARRRRTWITLSVVAVLLIGVNAYAAYRPGG